MNLAKRQLEKEEEYKEIVKEILIKIGALKTCACGTLTYETGSMETQQIYGSVINYIKKECPENDDYKLIQHFIDLELKEAHLENDCQYCNNIYND